MAVKHTNIPASYLILRQENQILLLRRLNTGYHDGDYSLVAWHVDPGETFTQTIIREAREEAWITLTHEDLNVVHVMHRHSWQGENSERVDVFIEAKKRQGEITNIEPHKCDDLSWFDMDHLPTNIIPCIRHALESIQQWVFYSEFGWENT